MNDQQKSVQLAKLCGWEIVPSDGVYGNHPKEVNDENGLNIWMSFLEGETPFNLYAPENMALAWRVVEWVTLPPKTIEESKRALNVKFGFWWRKTDLWAEVAADAQRLWLDKILELATEAGLI